MLKSSQAYPKEEKMLNNPITLLVEKMKDGLRDGNQSEASAAGKTWASSRDASLRGSPRREPLLGRNSWLPST